MAPLHIRSLVRRGAGRRRSRWARLLPIALVAPSLVAVGVAAPPAAALDPGCVAATNARVVCTYVGGPGTWNLTVPAGATELDFVVTGENGVSSTSAFGGRAARITGTRGVVPGQTMTVAFLNDGGLPGPSAGPGGGSALVTLSGGSVVAHAAGGGGAGAGNDSGAGGFGGSAGVNGGAAGGNGTGNSTGGGRGATSSGHGAGGSGACISFPSFCVDDGDPGTSSRGGAGGNEFSTGVGGGGGGGGAFKGGGGGAGFSGTGASGAGGGGGASIVPFGAAFGQASTGEERRVTLTFRSPVASFSATALNFGNVRVGTTSAPLNLTITNIGSAPLTVSNISVGGPYTRTTTCFNGPLAPGSTCSVSVTFSPVARGVSNATLFVVSDSRDGSVGIPVTGTGVEPVASLTPTSVAFGSLLVGSPPAPQTVTMRNTGNADLVITSATLTGINPTEFTESDDGCTGATLAPTQTCTVDVAFTPSSTGAKTAQLRFTDNAPNSPHLVGLSGTGTLPAVDVTPSQLAFGNQTLGTTSGSLIVTIENTGTGPLGVSSVTLAGAHPGDFSIGAHTCDGTIPAGGSCDVPVRFDPRKRGARTALLRFTDTAAGSPHEVSLTGTALALGDLQVKGPGSVFTPGRGSLVTLAVASGGTANFGVKVVNTTTTARSYEIALTSSRAASTATLNSGLTQLSKNPAGNYVTAVIQPGKSLTYALKVKPLGPGQVTSGVEVHLVAANGAEHDLVRTEANIKAPTKGTDSFTLFAKAGSQPNVGGAVNGQTTTANSVALNGTATYTVTLRNDGTSATAMTFRMAGTANACWTTKATTKQGLTTVDITSAAMGSGYLSRVLAVGGAQAITVTMKRLNTSCSPQTWQVSSYDGGTLKHFSHLLANPSA